MANQILINTEEINQITNDLSSLTRQLQETYNRMISETAIITERWKSQAAVNTVNKIMGELKNLTKAISAVEESRNYILLSTKKIEEADKGIRNNIISIIGG